MSVRFAYRRGPGSSRRVAHLARFDPVTGDVVGTLCQRRDAVWDTTCNLPLGLRQCQRCVRAYYEAQR